ncbi:MAG: ABC transporter substrate-binding protein [Chloroflexota bacterium]|nr:ABC transporter substrate-binding protein [Chloroflexota bacterium]
MSTSGPRTVLRALSAMEEYELADYRTTFQAEHPDIALSIERLSTRHLHARVLQLGETDTWDVILGWAVTSLLDPAILALLDTIDQGILALLSEEAVDPCRKWMSPSAFAPAFCISESPLRELGLPVPSAWEDLADTRLRGAVCLPDPNVSGAGFLHLSALVEERGLDDAVKVLAGVADNDPIVVESAFAPCVAVLEKRALVGVTVTTATERLSRGRHNVVSVIPSDARRYEPEAFAINRHSPRRAECGLLLRWMTGVQAARISAAYGKVVTTRAVAGEACPLAPVDARAAVRHRSELCSIWSSLFEKVNRRD